MMKKIWALVLAVMMIAMVGLAWASDAENGNTATDGIAGNTSGVWAATDTPIAQGNTVTLYKEITAYNPETCVINAPTITYSYTIAAATVAENTEIYDAAGNHNSAVNAHVYVKPGVGVPVISTSTDGTTFSSGTDANKLQITPALTMNASSTGVANKYKIHITFDPTNFNAAGVYRYEITEAATSYGTSGVVDGGISAKRYLDVYVKDKIEDNVANGYEIYGYVCFQNNNSISATTTDNTVTAAAKTEGFVATTSGGPDGETTQTADEYYTYNLTITKELKNDQAMNTHKFPFSLDFVNTLVKDNVLPIVTGTGTVPTLTAGDINGMDQDGTNLKLANGETAIFTGIPVGTTVTINEQNDVTGTVYTTSTTGGTTNQGTGLAVNWGTWTNDVSGWTTVTALQKTANDNTVKATDNITITFINTLLQISPTGVVLRVAPYLAMLAAGIALIVVFAVRRRKHVEEE